MSESGGATRVAIALGLMCLVGVTFMVPVLGGAAGGQAKETATTAAAALLLEASQACATSGPVAGLDPQQAADADEVVAAAFAASKENEMVAEIAVMVALTESDLHNLGPLPDNAGSLGLFQQRGWGTPAEELDPPVATALFVQRLLATQGWEEMLPWQAAQAVQRSAFSDGSNYQAHWAAAGQILAQVLGKGNQAGSCGQGVPAGVAGPPSGHGLPAGYTVPAGTGPAHAAVVAWALRQLGKPYVWGAAGPASFDCSGLTQAAWATAGVALLHYTVDQQAEGAAANPGALMAGDLVLIPGSDAPGAGEAGHVGIYVGNGLVESAIDPAQGVAVQSWQTFVSGGLDAVRDPDPADG